MQIKEGITRTVLVFGTKVIKFPTLNYGWKYFLQGLLANIQERDLWKSINKYSELPDAHLLLCPVSFCFPGGWFLIMPKADIERHEREVFTLGAETKCAEVWKKTFYQKWFDANLDGDEKPDNFGYYQDRLVKVDYGSIS